MATTKASLHKRVVVSAILFGVVLSALFALTAMIVAEVYEHLLVEDLLKGEAETYAARAAVQADAVLPASARVRSYLRRRDDHGGGGVPAEFVALSLGVTEIEPAGGDELHVGVYDVPAGRLYIAMNMSSIVRLERVVALFSIVVVLVGALLSAWVGWVLGGGIVDPVRRLGMAVSARSPGAQTPALAPSFADDEVGALARTFDGYHERLMAYAERERAFAAEASHGLRTPIAVIRGALEVLLDAEGLDSKTTARLQRIERASATLADLVDALLALAHAITPERLRWQPIELSVAVASALAAQSSLLEQSHIPVELHVESDDMASLPQRQLDAALRNLIRVMADQQLSGPLAVDVARQRVSMHRPQTATVRERSADEIPVDSSVGLGLVVRLAGAVGWTITVGESEDGHISRLTLHLSSST